MGDLSRYLCQQRCSFRIVLLVSSGVWVLGWVLLYFRTSNLPNNYAPEMCFRCSMFNVYDRHSNSHGHGRSEWYPHITETTRSIAKALEIGMIKAFCNYASIETKYHAGVTDCKRPLFGSILEHNRTFACAITARKIVFQTRRLIR